MMNQMKLGKSRTVIFIFHNKTFSMSSLYLLNYKMNCDVICTRTDSINVNNKNNYFGILFSLLRTVRFWSKKKQLGLVLLLESLRLHCFDGPTTSDVV